MSYLMKYRQMIFILSFVAALEFILICVLVLVIRNHTCKETVVKEYVYIEPEPIAVVEEIQPRIDCPLDDETQQMILEKCEEYNVDFPLVMSIIYHESRFQPDVISYNGTSYGLMQIHRINHEWMREELGITDFFDPEQNVTAGIYLLNRLFEKYEDPAMVLMAYGKGETGAKKLWDQGIYTSDYVEGVLQRAEIYKEEIKERMGDNYG